MRFRTLNKWWAFLSNHFWLPCPLCSQMWGGHEWNKIGQVRDDKGICPDCFKRLGPEFNLGFLGKEPLTKQAKP